MVRKVLFWLGLMLVMSSVVGAKGTVVLLHGLARSPHSMGKIGSALVEQGYQVLNIGYPSRKHTVEDLAKMVSAKVKTEVPEGETVHFVTHSLGGILVRYIQKHHPVDDLGRVVMLSPPNHGSEVVDKLGGLKLFEWVNGPAGLQLGTAKDGLISGLGPIDYEVGVITGDRSINWVLSGMISGKDDGKVSIESAKLEGVKGFKVVHATHPYIMKKKAVIADVVSFLATGKFVGE